LMVRKLMTLGWPFIGVECLVRVFTRRMCQLE
jgi:hypothetical protein